MRNLKIKTKIGVAFLVLFSLASFAQEGFGEIRGIIKNVQLEAVPYATVKILQGSQLVGGTQTDEKGRYNYKPLNAGSYEILVMSVEYMTQPVKGIVISPNEATYVDVKLTANTLETLTVTAKAITYTPPGVDRNMYSMVSVDYKDLNVNAGYVQGDLNSAVTAHSSDVIETKGELHFRGARGSASANYVDGVRTFGQTTIPGMAIENLTIFTGGVPACYGDIMGGVVVVTTKSYFSGIRDKNMRIAEEREQRAEEKRSKQAKADEQARSKEIEEEKKAEKTRN